MAGRRHPLECKVCGARAPYVTVSATGLCPDHSRLRLERNVRALVEHTGPEFERWRRAMAASVGGMLVDEAGELG